MSATVVQVIVGGLLLGAVYALFSSGLTLIWGMMNVVNFAHGDFVMLAMYTAFLVWKLLGIGPAGSVPIAALLLATLGVVAYFALVRHVMRGPMIAQISRCSCATRSSGASARIFSRCRTTSSAAPSRSSAFACRLRASSPEPSLFSSRRACTCC
jgi:hypothetical protein